MVAQIRLGDVRIEVVRKNIKNLHLSVYPPLGKVRIAAPERMDLDAIRVFSITKLQWIRKQQKKLREQQRETAREYLERESHHVWGRRFLLRIVEREAAPAVELKHNKMYLYVRPGSDTARRHSILEDWYRALLRQAIPPLLAKWEPIIGVRTQHVYIQRMKTKWGACNHVSRNIRLNTDLAKKPPECLEYITVHELVHLLEPTHNHRFNALLEQLMPKSQFYRNELNRLPVRHETWAY
ncbi:MAG: M48 family metallopeptidase [Rudaea sp.]